MNQNEIALANEKLKYKESELIKIEEYITEEIENAILQITLSEEEIKNLSKPDSLVNVIKNEIVDQFAKQTGLHITNESLIQKYDREHPEDFEEVADRVMKDKNYTEQNKKMKEAHKSGTLKDSYTGETLDPHSTKANLDHINPKRRIFDDPRRKQAGLSTEELANRKSNLAPTNETLNKSKGKKTNSEFIKSQDQRKIDLAKSHENKINKIKNSNKSEVDKKREIEKAEKSYHAKLNYDEDLMLNKQKISEKDMNKEIIKNATKNTIKKASKDFLKDIAVKSLTKLLSRFMNALLIYLKSKNKSRDSLLKEIKMSVISFFSDIKSIILSSTDKLIGTIVTEIFGPILSTFKKLSSIIKTCIGSVIESINALKDSEKVNDPIEVKIAHITKIVIATISTSSGLLMSEVIEKILLNIPGMSIGIPGLGINFSQIISVFLSSSITAIIGAIVINLIDNLIINIKSQTIKLDILKQKNLILSRQNSQIQLNEELVGINKKIMSNNIISNHLLFNDELNSIKLNNETDDNLDFDILFSDMSEELNKLL